MLASDISDQTMNLFHSDEEPELNLDQPDVVVPESEYEPLPVEQIEAVPEFVLKQETASPFDLSTDEGIRAAADSSPMLKGYLERMKLDGINQGRQSRESELRRDEASNERVEQMTQALFDRYGIEVEPEDQNFFRVITKSNSDFQRVNLSKEYAERAADYFQLSADDRVAFTTHLESINSDPTETQNVASEMMQAVYNKGKQDAMNNLTPEILQNNPSVTNWIAQQAQSQNDSEDTARRIEASIRGRVPAVPTGSASSNGFNALEIAQMTASARDKYIDTLSEAQQDEVMTAMYEAVQRGQ